MIAMLVGEEHAIELGRRDPALFEPDHDLPRAQPAVHKNPAMIGSDQRAIPRAAAAEHGQSEHRSISSGRRRVSQIGNGIRAERMRVIPRLAKRAEGSLKRSIASAKRQAYSVSVRLILRGSAYATARSLAVCAARDDSALLARRYLSSPAIFVCGNASTRAFFAP